MSYFRPRPRAGFDGYYTKLSLPSQATLALVISSVPAAPPPKAHLLSLYYVPTRRSSSVSDGHVATDTPFKLELPVPAIHRIVPALPPDSGTDHVSSSSSPSRQDKHDDHSFTLLIPSVGHLTLHADNTTTISISTPHYSLSANIDAPFPPKWCAHSSSSTTPEGPLVHLPLPLHWHVHTLSSPATFTLDIYGVDLPEGDRAGTARAHMEKNWAISFPSMHMWVQGCRLEPGPSFPYTQRVGGEKDATYISLAGGVVYGLHAYLLSFRSAANPALNTVFRPPTALSVPLSFIPSFITKLVGLSTNTAVGCLTATPNWPTRSFRLCIQGLWKRIVVRSVAPRDAFVTLAAPYKEGHRENWLGETFETQVVVEVWGRDWIWRRLRSAAGGRNENSGWILRMLGCGPWRLMGTEKFEGAAMEFGGGYYDDRG